MIITIVISIGQYQHMYIDKTGDVQLYLDGQLRGAVGSYHYDKENIELVRKLD